MLGFKGPAQALSDPWRHPQRRISLTRGPLPWLRHALDCGAEHRPPGRRRRPSTNWNGTCAARTGPRLSLQAQPSGRASVDQDIGVQSAIDLLAGREVMRYVYGAVIFIAVVALTFVSLVGLEKVIG